MKQLGLIGGCGPESTVDYYRGIINGFRARTGGEDYPRILLNSIDMTGMLALVGREDWQGLCDLLAGEIERLAGAGADFAAIASNTPHIVCDRLRGVSLLPIVSIVDAACARAVSQGCRRVLFFGTLFTMRSSLYTAAFAAHDIEVVLPSPAQQEQIQGIIFPELEEGIVRPEKKAEMLGIAQSIAAAQPVDALVLGCTELPLMIRDGDLALPLLNTSAIHVDAILDEMLR